MYAIETGIPVQRHKHGNEVYPWRDLEVGQSFFVANGNLKSLRASASRMKREINHHFTVNPVDGGVRVWRVK